jgi:hypothetical protein
MALKPDRREIDSEIGFFMNHTAERGGVACLVTTGSGGAMDNANAAVGYAATSSGKVPIGYLTCDVVDVDLSLYHLNRYKDQVQKGGKVKLITQGVVVTNMLKSGDTFAVGDAVYLNEDGRVTRTNTGAIASPKVGTVLAHKDADGYAKIMFSLYK